MKITTATKLGTQVENKVNGKVYELTNWTDDKKESLVAVTVNPETGKSLEETEDGFDKIEVTEENGICFRTVSIPADEVIPEGYTVVNGELLLNGDSVTEQGEIFIEDILAALPGYLVLAVKPRGEKKDLVDLFIYEPERDKFTKLIRYNSIPMPVVVKELEGAVLLGYNKTHMEEVPDEDDVAVEVEMFDASALMLISNKKLDSAFYHRPMVFNSLKEVLGSESLFLISSNKTVEEGKVEDGKSPYYELVEVQVERTSVNSESIWNQPKSEILTAAVSKSNGGIVMKGKNYIQHNDECFQTALVEKVKGEYLVDVTLDGDNEIWTLATENYEVTRIQRTRTRDRGFIYSILK